MAPWMSEHIDLSEVFNVILDWRIKELRQGNFGRCCIGKSFVRLHILKMAWPNSQLIMIFLTMFWGRIWAISEQEVLYKITVLKIFNIAHPHALFGLICRALCTIPESISTTFFLVDSHRVRSILRPDCWSQVRDDYWYWNWLLASWPGAQTANLDSDSSLEVCSLTFGWSRSLYFSPMVSSA